MTLAVPTSVTRRLAALREQAGRLGLAGDPYRRLMFLVLVMNISRIHQHFRFLNPVRPALTITALAAIYAYMNPKFLVTGSLVRTWPAKAMAGLFAAACLSVPMSISIGGSGAFILFEFTKTIVFAFLVVAAIRNTKDLYTMMWAFVISSGALSYLSLFVFRMRKASDDGLLRIQSGYSYDSNDLATVAVTSLAIALLMVQTATGKGKTLAILIVAGLGATIAKTGSRGGFVGLLAFGVALLIMLKTVPVAKRVMFLVVTAIGLAIAAPPGYWEQMKTVMTPTEDYNWTSPTGRKQVFLRGIGYWSGNPVTGIGIDNFARAEGTISDRAIAQKLDPSLPGIKWSVAHNSFLEVLVEMGLVGFSFFCVLVFGGIFALNKLRRSLPRHWPRGTQEERFLYFASLYLPVAFAGFAASGFFVSFGYRDLIYTLGAFAAGLIVCVERKLREDRALAQGEVSPPVRAAQPAANQPIVVLPPQPSLRFPKPPPGSSPGA
jgi:O-antigen ligase